MDWDTFRPRRTKIAQQIFEALRENPPKDVLEVHSPDSLGSVGLKYADGYVLIQTENADK